MSLTYTPFLKQETTTPLTKINTHELQCLTKKDIDSPSLTTPPHHLQDPTHSQFTSSSFLFPTKRSLATSIHEPHGIHKTNSSSSSTTTTTTTNQPLEVTNDRLTKGNEMENKNKNEDNEDEDNEEEEEEELMLSINKKFSHLQLMEGATLSFNLSQAHAGSLESLESRRRSLNNSYGNHTRNATYLPGLVMNEPSYFYSLHDTIDIQHLLPNHQTALLNALDSNVLDHQFRAVTQLRRFLSLDKISKAIDLVLDLNRLPTLIGLLKLNNPSLQYELCWIFTNICAGTHHQTMHLVHHGFIPDLLDLLGRLPTFTMTSCPSNLDVHIQTYWCLGNLCGDSALLRHQLIQHGLIQVMVQHPSSSGSSTSSHETSSSLAFLQKHPWNPQYEAWVHFHRIFCWVMANLCRGTKTLEEWSWVAPLFPIMKRFLIHHDLEMVVDTCWGLSRILQGLCGFHLEEQKKNGDHQGTSSWNHLVKEIDQAFCEALVDVVTLRRFPDLSPEDALRLQTPALRALTNLASGDDSTLLHLVNAGVIPVLIQLASSSSSSSLASKTTLAQEALLALANVAAGPTDVLHVLLHHRISSVWASHLSPPSSSFTSSTSYSNAHSNLTDWVCARECVWGLANFTCSHQAPLIQTFLQTPLVHETGMGSFPPDGGSWSSSPLLNTSSERWWATTLVTWATHPELRLAEKASEALLHLCTVQSKGSVWWTTLLQEQALQRWVLPYWHQRQHPRWVAQFHSFLSSSTVAGGSGGASFFPFNSTASSIFDPSLSHHHHHQQQQQQQQQQQGEEMDAIMCDVQSMVIE